MPLTPAAFCFFDQRNLTLAAVDRLDRENLFRPMLYNSLSTE
jgi:hypothetical protein